MCVCVCFILKFQEKAISIWESKDFFIDLDPLPGGVEAVKEMAKMEKYVFKSLTSNKLCVKVFCGFIK